jgi:hypothetical protein
MLSYAVPYTIWPSKYRNELVSFTIRGATGAKAVTWMFALFSILNTLFFVYAFNEFGLFGMIHPSSGRY